MIVIQQNTSPNNYNYLKSITNEQNISKSDFNEVKQKPSLMYGHNPILNPTPHNNQNPYLAKEFNQRKNILSQMGQKSLI